MTRLSNENGTTVVASGTNLGGYKKRIGSPSRANVRSPTLGLFHGRLLFVLLLIGYTPKQTMMEPMQVPQLIASTR
jgi:hypothetical protein